MQKTVKEVQRLGCETVEVYEFDLGSKDINEAMVKCIADIKEKHGRIDLVISNGNCYPSSFRSA